MAMLTPCWHARTVRHWQNGMMIDGEHQQHISGLNLYF